MPTPIILEPKLTSVRKFEYNLEALRGFAALVVVLGHAVYYKHFIDPGYTPSSVWINLFPSHSSVLLFFILSGYVIGLTNPSPLTSHTILSYLRKRFSRLYPIYFISLLLTLIIIKRHYPFSTIFGNFLFLQNSVVPLIDENNPLWSLNSEVVYYLLFIPISYFKCSIKKAVIFSIFVGFAFGTVLPLPVISSYGFGFVFWLSGLWLARTTVFTKQHTSRLVLLSLLCLFLGYAHLNPFTTAAIITKEHLHIPFVDLGGAGIVFSDLVALPFCFYLFLRFSNHTVKYGKVFVNLTIVAGLLYYVHIAHSYGFASSQSFALLLPLVSFGIGSILWAFTQNKIPSTDTVLLPTWCIKLGAISYGIYVIHFPISIAISRINIVSGSSFSFVIRLLADLVIVFGIAYLLEMRVHRWIKSNLLDKYLFR